MSLGHGIDGGLTLSENIADNGGLLASIKGYELWRTKANQTESELEDGALPGLEFLSNDQLLFLGVIQTWFPGLSVDIVKVDAWLVQKISKHHFLKDIENSL